VTGGGVMKVVYWITRRLIRPRLSGLAGLAGCGGSGAAVYVANHSGAFGPIMVMSCLPFRVRPWVTYEITEPAACAGYLNEDFTAGELRLKEPLSRWLALLISPICVLLMKRVGGVPVYRNSRRIVHTMTASRALLAGGEKLVIFPEKPGRAGSGFVGELDTGFLSLAKSFYADRGEALHFFPLAVNKETRTLSIGSALTLDLKKPFAVEKRRFRRQLEESIARLCRDGAGAKSSSSR
jgi:hypothetical protein